MLQGVNYKEALKVLKLVVTRSSSLVAPPTSTHYIYWDSHATASHYSFSDIDVFMKKELPGNASMMYPRYHNTFADRGHNYRAEICVRFHIFTA